MTEQQHPSEQNTAVMEEIRGNKPWSKHRHNRLSAVIGCVLLLSLLANGYLGARYDALRRYVSDMEIHYSESYFYFDSLTVESFQRKVASGEEFIVLISRPNCSNCARLEQPLIEFAQELGIADQIYHLNVVLLHQDENAWSEFKAIYGLEGTPTYARYANGALVSNVGWTHEHNIDLDMVTAWMVQQSDYFGI